MAEKEPSLKKSSLFFREINPLSHVAAAMLESGGQKGQRRAGGWASLATGVTSSCHRQVVPSPKHRDEHTDAARTDGARTASAYLKLMANTS